MKQKRTAKVSALDAIKLVLDNAPHIQEFEDQIRMIHAFTQDILDGKLDSEEDSQAEKMDYEHLAEVVGSLSISQFKGTDKQEQYRSVINEIFRQYQEKE